MYVLLCLPAFLVLTYFSHKCYKYFIFRLSFLFSYSGSSRTIELNRIRVPLPLKKKDRRLYALPVKFGGLGLPDPTQTADAAHTFSRAATQHLSSAIKGRARLCLKEHSAGMRTARAAYKAAKVAANQQEYERLTADLTEDQQRVVHSAASGHPQHRQLAERAPNGSQRQRALRQGLARGHCFASTGSSPKACSHCATGAASSLMGTTPSSAGRAVSSYGGTTT